MLSESVQQQPGERLSFHPCLCLVAQSTVAVVCRWLRVQQGDFPLGCNMLYLKQPESPAVSAGA